jgi:hypothetical protein
VYQLVSDAQSSVESVAAKMMIRPPMVGVPAFSMCEAGPDSRTTWPTPTAFSRRITTGPARNAITSDVTTAPADRKVR